MQVHLFIAASLLSFNAMAGCRTHNNPASNQPLEKTIYPGANSIESYLPYLQGKRTAVFGNHTSLIGKTHIVDTLIKRGVNITAIFSPEHGFRGDADAGEKVKSGKDPITGIPVVSLYGERKKPKPDDLRNTDIIVFDIQDVGARFYTYISSLQYVMEAALENDIPLIILDRPNPNGWYVDGPVLDKRFKSFVGMQPVPIVYGMTMGEYGLMIAGEGWLTEKANKKFKEKNKSKAFAVKVIPCRNYDHNSKYKLPVPPSPNLREMQSVYLYPSTCLFEGTILSEGRGTDKPFRIFGHPDLPADLYSFTPSPNKGAKTGKCFYRKCYGWNIAGTEEEILKQLNGKIKLSYMLDAYSLFPGKDSFFIEDNFRQKAGNDQLMNQIRKGMTEEEIRKTWKTDLEAFKKIRKKYLLYKDFSV